MGGKSRGDQQFVVSIHIILRPFTFVGKLQQLQEVVRIKKNKNTKRRKKVSREVADESESERNKEKRDCVGGACECLCVVGWRGQRMGK